MSIFQSVLVASANTAFSLRQQSQYHPHKPEASIIRVSSITVRIPLHNMMPNCAPPFIRRTDKGKNDQE